MRSGRCRFGNCKVKARPVETAGQTESGPIETIGRTDPVRGNELARNRAFFAACRELLAVSMAAVATHRSPLR